MSINNIKSVLNFGKKSLDVYSFDFFDTLIQRNIDEKQLIKQCVRDFFNADSLQVDETDFLNEVELAEVNERYATQQLGFDKEAKLIVIYQQVFSALDLDCERLVEFYRFVVNREKENFFLADGVVDVLSALKSKNKKIIIISDTYYSLNDFEGFLDFLAIKLFIDELYLSSEIKLNKASGNMFSYMLKKEQVLSELVLHTGDNVFSDVDMAKRFGLNTLHIQHKDLKTSDAMYQSLVNFGYETIGPVLYDFIEELITEHNDKHSFFFLARDGFLLKAIFDLIQANSQFAHQIKNQVNQKAAYLYINRIIANQVTTKTLSHAVISSVSTHYKSEGLFGLVTVFGLNNSIFSREFSLWLKQKGLSENTFIDEVNSQLLLKEHALIGQFERCLATKSVNAIKYINKYITDHLVNNITLVDVGWRGSIAKQLIPLFSGIKKGYLLAYTEQTINHNNEVAGYINATNSRQSYLACLSENRDIIEYFLSENISNVIGIKDNLVPDYLVEKDELVNNEATKNSLTPLPVTKNTRNIVQEAILNYCTKRCKTTMSVSDFQQQKHLMQLQQFLMAPSIVFCQAVSDIEVDINIQGKSSITMQELTSPMQLAANNKVSATHIKNKQSMLYQFLTFVKTLQAEQDLVLYGAGSGTEFILPHLNNCRFIVDINEKIHGNHIESTPIKALNELSYFNGIIVVTVIGRKNQIEQNLSAFIRQKNIKLYFLEDYL